MKINRLITNKITFPKNTHYAAIIGTSPSKSARSPKLWNKVYKKLKSKTKMIPLDVKKKELKKLMRVLKKDKNYSIRCNRVNYLQSKIFYQKIEVLT